MFCFFIKIRLWKFRFVLNLRLLTLSFEKNSEYISCCYRFPPHVISCPLFSSRSSIYTGKHVKSVIALLEVRKSWTYSILKLPFFGYSCMVWLC